MKASTFQGLMQGVREAGAIHRGELSPGRLMLELPEPPSANVYWRHVVIGGKPRTLLSREARAYRLSVKGHSLMRRVKPIAGPVAVTVRWIRQRKAGDLDNRLKQLLDALRGLAFRDDAEVVELHAYRSDDREAGLSGTVQVTVTSRT